MFADYECVHCGKIHDYKKPYGENFPEQLEMKCCIDETICRYRRVFTKPVIDIPEGMLGNAKNGYTSGLTHHRSVFTPKKLDQNYGRGTRDYIGPS